MSGMLFLMFVQSLFQFGAKVGKREGYYGEKNYLHMSFVSPEYLILGEISTSMKKFFSQGFLHIFQANCATQRFWK